MCVNFERVGCMNRVIKVDADENQKSWDPLTVRVLNIIKIFNGHVFS